MRSFRKDLNGTRGNPSIPEAEWKERSSSPFL